MESQQCSQARCVPGLRGIRTRAFLITKANMKNACSFLFDQHVGKVFQLLLLPNDH